MTPTEPGIEQARRKASAAKSLLSRYENQRREAGRSGADIKALNALQEIVDKQRAVFRESVRRWRELSKSSSTPDRKR